MIKQCLTAIGLALFSVPLAFAAAPFTADCSPSCSACPVSECPVSECHEPAPACLLDAAPHLAADDCAPTPSALQFWMTADYLLWWVKNAPASTPLITRGSPTDPIPGALGQPGTSVLFGAPGVDYGSTSGLRLNAGVWCDAEQRLGLDGGYFALERRASSFRVSSNANGDPVLAVPAFDVQTPGGEISEVASIHDPFFGPLYNGGVGVSTTMRLQGYDLNLAVNVARSETYRVTLLGGYRALSLDEALVLQTNSTEVMPQILSFNGVFFNPPGAVTTLDSFNTANKFYGGQVGGRFDYHFGAFTLDLMGKVALGATQSLTTINGVSSFLAPGSPPIMAPGGIFALPTNMGRHVHTAFSVVPEGAVNLTVRLTSHLDAEVGYSFLYWNNVERAGNQIDRNINPRLIPTDQGFGSGGGPGRPTFAGQQSDFWAQGLNFGLVLHF